MRCLQQGFYGQVRKAKARAPRRQKADTLQFAPLRTLLSLHLCTKHRRSSWRGTPPPCSALSHWRCARTPGPPSKLEEDQRPLTPSLFQPPPLLRRFAHPVAGGAASSARPSPTTRPYPTDRARLRRDIACCGCLRKNSPARRGCDGPGPRRWWCSRSRAGPVAG